MIYSRNVISITGIIPDDTLPITSPNVDPTSVVIYYRTDGNLYLYDLQLMQEFDLFNMPFDGDSIFYHDHIIHPFNHS